MTPAASRLHRLATRLHHRQSGQGMAEYALTLALIAVVVVVALQLVGKAVSSATCSVGVGLDNTTICNNLVAANVASLETSAAGWGNAVNTTLAQTSVAAYDGTHSLAMTTQSVSGMAAATVAAVPASAGQTYTASAYFAAASTAATANVQIYWGPVGGGTAYITGPTVTDAVGSWTHAIASGTAPAGTTSMNIVVESALNATSLQTHYVDHISLLAGAANLMSAAGASFEDGTNGGWSGNGNDTLSNVTSNAHDGTHALRITKTSGTYTYAVSGSMPVVAGQAYTAMYFLTITPQPTLPGAWIDCWISWLDSTGSTIWSNRDASTQITTGQFIFNSTTAPVGAVTAAYGLYETALPIGTTFDLDSTAFIPAATVAWQPGY